MKNIFITSVVVLMSFTFGYSQNPTNHALQRSVFLDAQEIKKPEEKDKILAFYFKDNAEILAFNRAYGTSVPSFTTNPAEGSLREVNDRFIQSGAGIGGLSNPTIAIDAIGSFIANRFKQEINIAFLDKFKKDFKTIPYMAELLPQTNNVLLVSDPYDYPVFISSLEQAFRDDMENLPTNILIVLEKKYPGDENVRTAVALLSGFTEVRSVVSAKDFIIELSNNINNAELKKQISILAIAVNSVYKGGEGDDMFIKGDDFYNFNNEDFLKYYTGLLIRQNELYFSQAGVRNKFQTDSIELVKKFAGIFNSVSNQAKIISSESAKKQLTPDFVQSSLSVLIKALGDVVKLAETFQENDQYAEISRYIGYAGNLNDTYKFIVEKKYGLAIINSINLIDIFAPKALSPDQLKAWNRYGGFINNVIVAENKDEIMAALETSANPVGSYRVKRNSTFNISLNAYAGGFGGVGNDAVVYGFTAPVGLYFGWGNIGNKDIVESKGKSIGVFLSLIDVGAVTAFRLQDSDTEMADVTWDNVFSPGAYITFGFGRCPVSLNLGGQMGPELTKVKSDGTPEFVKKEWYWRAALVVDIPLFDLFTKQRAYN